ncbi:MAG: type IV pilus biogenesis protein PilM [Thermoleophilaceae bacterium]
MFNQHVWPADRMATLQMALRLGNRAARQSVGLDLDGSYISAVAISDGIIQQAATADLPAGLIRDGEVEDVDGLAQAIKSFFRGQNLGKNVLLGVANQQIAVRSLEIPPIEDAQERTAAVRFQASEAVAMPLDEAVLDYEVIGETTTGEGSSLLRVIVVAAREPMIMRLVDAVRGAGLRPDGIDLSAFALMRIVAPENEAEPAPARIYCHLAGVTNLAVGVGNTCVFTRPLATVWDGGSQEFVSALAEEIRLSMDYYVGQPDARQVGEILLSGPGSQRPGMAEQVAGLVGLPVAVAQPLGRLGAASLRVGDDPSRYTVAAGLALGGSA